MRSSKVNKFVSWAAAPVFLVSAAGAGFAAAPTSDLRVLQRWKAV
jgi:hypothetical protein